MMCVNLSKCVDIIFFSFTSTKKYIYINKVSFVDPAIIINKNNILFKKKEKKIILKKKKSRWGSNLHQLTCSAFTDRQPYPLGHVVPEYLWWQNESMVLGLLTPPSLIGDDRK